MLRDRFLDRAGRKPRRLSEEAAEGANVAPALGVTSLAFGIWYATAAWALAPYPF